MCTGNHIKAFALRGVCKCTRSLEAGGGVEEGRGRDGRGGKITGRDTVERGSGSTGEM